MMASSVPRGRVWLFLAISLCGAAFDLATKSIVFREVGPPGSPPVAVIPDILELRTSYNPGALWGFGRGLPYSSRVFAGLSILAGVGICYYLFVRGAASDGRLTVALGLIMAGALGNCFDRLVHGHVRDFVHFHVDAINFDCAIFNFADNMLIAGALILMYLALQPEAPPASAQDALENSEAGGQAPTPIAN